MTMSHAVYIIAEMSANHCGDMNLAKKIIAAAKDAGTEWVVVEQDQPSMGLSAMESIKKSVEYLKSFEW